MRGDDRLKVQRTHGDGAPEIYLVIENTLEERVEIIRHLQNEVAIRGMYGGRSGMGGSSPDR